MFKILKEKIKTILKNTEKIDLKKEIARSIFGISCALFFSFIIPKTISIYSQDAVMSVFDVGVPMLLNIVMYMMSYYMYRYNNESKEFIKNFVLNEKNTNKEILILKGYFLLKNMYFFNEEKNKEKFKNLSKEFEILGEDFLKIDSVEELKYFIKISDIDKNNLLIEIEKLPFSNKYFIDILDLKKENQKNVVKREQFNLLVDNNIISNKINELINCYNFIYSNESKLNDDEKILLNKVTYTMKKSIEFFNEIKKFKNEESEKNLILLLEEINVIMEKLNQSIQEKLIINIKVLHKTLQIEN